MKEGSKQRKGKELHTCRTDCTLTDDDDESLEIFVHLACTYLHVLYVCRHPCLFQGKWMTLKGQNEAT